MLTQDQKMFFEREGYLLVPGVLTGAEVLGIRTRILDIFRSGDWKKSPFNT